jgi:hypothetical protein
MRKVLRRAMLASVAVSCVVTGLAGVCPSAMAFEQEPATRAEADRQRRAEKERAAHPYQPNSLERGMHLFEEKAIFLLDREGFYPKLGSLTVGSGFAYGLGFRDRDLFNHYGMLDVWAAGSIRRYSAVEGRFSFPELAGKKLMVEAWGSRRDYPRENFFGIGPNSERDNQSDYGIRTNHLGVRAGVRPAPMVLAGGGVELQHPVVYPGHNEGIPNAQDMFGPSALPGGFGSSDVVRSLGFVEVDYRQPRNARKGGWYRLDFSHYDDRTNGLYTFNRFDVDLRQFVSVLAERRVLAARLFVSTSGTPDGSTMPFFYMPTLGGNDTLRGFRDYRFRGPHAILMQGEYRWEIWSGLDGALFYDAGKVANRRADLDLDDLEHDYGFGVRFNTNSGVVLRVDAAFGSRDGKHLFIVFGGVF